jgi:hypothetical protein
MVYPFRTSLAVLAVAVVLCDPGKARADMPYQPYEAIYELSLVQARGLQTASSARGRLFSSFSGSACEGYTSKTRQVLEVEVMGKLILIDTRATSWEDGAGKSYRFKIETRTNDSDPSVVAGVAERTDDHITVNLKQPENKTFTIDGSTVFPIEQLQRTIAAAKAGKSLLEFTVYDGSDNGEKIRNALTAIEQPIPGDKAVESPDPSTTNEKMKSLTRWPITVNYYDRQAKDKQTPIYTMSFELFENGAGRNLVLDYRQFVISGALGRFDIKDSEPCK